MADEKGTLEQGIAKAKAEVTTKETEATTARTAAESAWSKGDPKTAEGRNAILAANTKAESADSAVARAKGTVSNLEAALADLGKQAFRDGVQPIMDDDKKATLANVERHKGLIQRSPGFTGYVKTVNFETESGVPDISYRPIGEWFAGVKRTGGGKGNGGSKGQRYTYSIDNVTYATAREFIDSPHGAKCISAERRQAVTDGKAGATAVANAGAKVAGIVPVPVVVTPAA